VGAGQWHGPDIIRESDDWSGESPSSDISQVLGNFPPFLFLYLVWVSYKVFLSGGILVRIALFKVHESCICAEVVLSFEYSWTRVINSQPSSNVLLSDVLYGPKLLE
jgi:hypothetical protein